MSPHPILSGKSARQIIEDARRARDPGDEIQVDFEDEARDHRAIMPWWRRIGEWLVDLHKGVASLAGIAAASVGLHAWIHGLPSKKDIGDIVTEAVRTAMSAEDARISTLEVNTRDLPTWRSATQDKIVTHDVTLAALVQRADKLENRVDNLRIR